MQDGWPRDFWELGKLLLHQQCWCWGQDVRSPKGNLLCQFGFERERPEHPGSTSTRYTLRGADGPRISLWAFGLLVVLPGEGGIYIGRYCFVPSWIPQAERHQTAWKPDEFSGYRPPQTRQEIRVARRLVRWMLELFCQYESWVLQQAGLDWRRQSLREWHEPPILPECLANEWRRLSWHIPEPPPCLPLQNGRGRASI